jgi:hypothetical protein
MGCTSRTASLGSPLSQAFDAARGRPISARGCGFMAGDFIPIVIHSRVERAQRALLAKAGDDYVTDVRLEERWIFAFVGTVHCTEIFATAYPRA